MWLCSTSSSLIKHYNEQGYWQVYIQPSDLLLNTYSACLLCICICLLISYKTAPSQFQLQFIYNFWWAFFEKLGSGVLCPGQPVRNTLIGCCFMVREKREKDRVLLGPVRTVGIPGAVISRTTRLPWFSQERCLQVSWYKSACSWDNFSLCHI